MEPSVLSPFLFDIYIDDLTLLIAIESVVTLAREI